MESTLPRIQSQRGQGLIEAILGLAIILILLHAFGSLIIAAYDLLGNSRTRLTARQLANAQIETIHNLPYDKVGVVGGIPPGSLQQLQTVTANGLQYAIRTSVVYIDDPADQLAPNDPYPADYKRVRVDASWTGRFVAGESVTFITDIASSQITSGGTLSILVFDSSASAVPQADVRIVNTKVNPPIDLSLKTDDVGRLTLPGAPACDTCYEITVSHQAYSTDRTYSTAEIANPAKPHASVIEKKLTEISFAIDKTATVNITSTMGRDESYSPLANKTFRLTGNKTIGTNDKGKPVYKYDKELQTNAAGKLALTDMEWDSYRLTLPAGGSWDLSGTNPLRPMIVIPASQLNLLFASVSHSTNSLLLAVTDASGSAIASASARLSVAGYDKTIFTGDNDKADFGQAFFSNLSATTYNLDVTKVGFVPKSETVNVSGQTEYTTQLDSL